MNIGKSQQFLLLGSSVGLVLLLVLVYRDFIQYKAPSSFIENAQAQQAVPSFDPQSVTWSEATSSAEWETRDSAVSFVFKNKIWTMGGLDGNQKVNPDHTVLYWEAPHLNDIWNSDDGVHWTLVKEHAEWAKRRSMSVVEFNGSLWLFGGWSPVTEYQSDVWNSTDGITWTKVLAKAAWPPREGQTAEVFQGKIWMMGGVNYAERKTLSDVWWSDNGLDWHEATSSAPWSTRWDHATAVFNGRLYLVAGMAFHAQMFKDVWSTIDGSHWELLTNTPPWQERQGLSLVVFHNKLWMIGRLNDAEDGGGVNDVWYSDDGVSWHKTHEDPLWLGREDHSVLLFNDRMVVFGGMDANQHWRNDVWFSSL